MLTVVTYHYVRPLARTRYPAIKGRDLEEFRSQVRYLRAHYHPVTAADVIAAWHGDDSLPERALLLSFDDGYLDHYTYVAPILDEMGMSGVFACVAMALLDRRVLDVNKIHFVLATAAEPRRLLDRCLQLVRPYRKRFRLADDATLISANTRASRFDAVEVVVLKRLLQVGLPAEVRRSVIDCLFREDVTDDETAFAEELYLSVDQARALARHGFTLAHHSYSHPWLGEASDDAQADEITRGLEVLHGVGLPSRNWVMCYPYGSRDDRLDVRLAHAGCALGLTTRSATATLADPALQIPRLDTNELPLE